LRSISRHKATAKSATANAGRTEIGKIRRDVRTYIDDVRIIDARRIVNERRLKPSHRVGNIQTLIVAHDDDDDGFKRIGVLVDRESRTHNVIIVSVCDVHNYIEVGIDG
jgi:hypothetical protein